MEEELLEHSKSHASHKDGEEVILKQLAGNVMLGDVIWVRLEGGLWWPGQVVDENAVSESNKLGKRSVEDVLVRIYGSYEYLYANPVKFHSDFEKILEQNRGSHSEIFKKALEQDCSRSKSGRSKVHKSASTEAKCPSCKQDWGQKKCKHKQCNGSSNAEESERNGALKKPKLNNARAEREGKVKSSLGEGSQKILKPKSIRVEETQRSCNLRQNKIPKKGNCESENADHLETKIPKRIHLTNKGKLDSPRLETALSPELSARRIRVMQTLGLMAPCGSPFRSSLSSL